MNNFDISVFWPNWEIAGLIGKGPFGEVYLAKHKVIGDDFDYEAVKVITMPPEGFNEEVAAGKRQMVNFSKYQNDLTWEMTMFRTVEAPGFIKPNEMLLKRNSDDTGWICAVRAPLYTPVKDYFGNKANERDVVRMGIELCKTLMNSSNLGLVHGDIKPNNIMVDNRGHFHISDFGIRKCLDSANAVELGPETLDFDAPEVDATGRFFAVSDLYSVGMSMAYVLNGCAMPTGKNISLIRCNNQELIKILKTATSYDPRDRYRSAGDMLAALDRLKFEQKTVIKRADALKNAMKRAKLFSKQDLEIEDFEDDRPRFSFFEKLFSIFKSPKVSEAAEEDEIEEYDETENPEE